MTVNYLNMVQGGGKIPRRRFEKRRGTQLHDLVTLADRKELVPLGSQTGKISVAAGSGQDRVRRGSGVGNEFRTLGGEISNAISRNADSRNPKSLSLPIAHGKTTSTKAIRSWSNVVRLLNTTGWDTLSALR